MDLGGGVLGDFDSGLATDWWRWCRYFVWGDIMINTFNLNFNPLHRIARRERKAGLSLYIYIFWFVTYL